MVRTRGGRQQVSPRRSRRTQGLDATPATNIKVHKTIAKPKNKPGRKKIVVADDIEDITPKNIPEDGMVEDEDKHHKESRHEVSEKEADDEVSEKEADDDVNMEHQATEKAVSEQEESRHEVPEKEADDDVSMEHQATEKAVSEQPETTHQVSEKGADDDVNVEQHRNTDEVVKKKKRRGPTKMRKVAGNPQEKVEVTFTECGDHVGPGSVTLSSFLGPLVREHVPVTFTNWKKVDPVTKETLWEEIQVHL